LRYLAVVNKAGEYEATGLEVHLRGLGWREEPQMKDLVCKDGAVVAADDIAAAAGVDILRRGGNAVDAAIASALAECVVAPHNVGIGGYAGSIVLYSAKEDATVAVDFDGVAPLAAEPDMFWGKRYPSIVGSAPGPHDRGPMCVVAPPMVAGFNAVLERYGTMKFAEVAEEARRLADEGFAVYPALADALAHFAREATRESVRAMLPNGIAPKAGEVYVQKDLATLIARLQSKGPGAFYSGDIARTISSAVRKQGGILDEADFAKVSPRFEKPLSATCGEYEVFTPQPPAGGLTSLQVLKVMDLAGFSASGNPTARDYHLLIEAAKHAWNDRHVHFGDPRSVDIPMGELLSTEHAREILSRIESGAVPKKTAAEPTSAGHTVHLVTADKDRNMVSLTATQGAGLGSFVAIEGLGLLLGNGMSRFEREPGGPNSIAPGKQMQHNMCPLFIKRSNKPYCAIGLPGGRKIVNVAALLSCAITKRSMTCGEAMELPKFHVEGYGPAEVNSKELAKELKQEYGADYPVTAVGSIGGMIAGVMVCKQTGHLLAASSGGTDKVAAQ
jgi:gamma-glutamyltranspeptidase/glutathione hydrolase